MNPILKKEFCGTRQTPHNTYQAGISFISAFFYRKKNIFMIDFRYLKNHKGKILWK